MRFRGRGEAFCSRPHLPLICGRHGGRSHTDTLRPLTLSAPAEPVGVGVNHQSDHLVETDPRLPAQHSICLGGVPNQTFHLGRTPQRFVEHDVVVDVDAACSLLDASPERRESWSVGDRGGQSNRRAPLLMAF